VEAPVHALIEAHRPEIEALCRRFAVRRLEVFGSAARGDDFDASLSDADFLVEFAPEAALGLGAYQDLKDALAQVLGRPVDLVERPAIERSRNYIRRRHILEEVEPVYVA
jgi:predicted nucleotidyltransferase